MNQPVKPAFCASALAEIYGIEFGKALTSLRVRRAPNFDAWAQAQNCPRHIDTEYAKLTS
jgi:hypothetical protein